MEDRRPAVVMVQEHKADNSALPVLQCALKDMGYRGILAPSIRTAQQGVSSGSGASPRVHHGSAPSLAWASPAT
eukprot:5035026-Pyramimonas_sp.AAC.1